MPYSRQPKKPMIKLAVTDDEKTVVKHQKIYYKDSAKSPCRKCENYNYDCFDAMKICGKDEKTGYSVVEKCGSYKDKTTIPVAKQ